MVKAKDFWNYLCEELDYRFFAGVACSGLNPLYKKMNSKFMHYIPAVNERIGLGLVSGAYMAGYKGALLMDMVFAYDINSFIKFSIDNEIPLLIIGYSEAEGLELIYDLPLAFIVDDSFKKDVHHVVSRSESEKTLGLIIIEKGVLI